MINAYVAHQERSTDEAQGITQFPYFLDMIYYG